LRTRLQKKLLRRPRRRGRGKRLKRESELRKKRRSRG